MKKHILGLLALSSAFVGGNLVGDEIIAADFCGQDAVVNESCNQGIYAGAFVGGNFLQHGGEFGFTGGLSVGYKSEYNFRAEAEFAYRRNEIGCVTGQTFSYMANLCYDFDMACAWTPYLGLGIGYAHSTGSNMIGWRSRDYRSDNFAFQGIVGISRPVWENTELGIEYRCFAFSSCVRDHSVLAAVKRYF